MPGAHAPLSPSAAKRWCACPPSARLNQKYVDMFGEKSSSFAEEGTKAHALAELKLRYENKEIPNKFNFDAQVAALGEITKEMDKNTDMYVDTVMEKLFDARRKCPDARLFIEQRLNMEQWIPGCFGTSDAVIVSDSGLEIVDYKNGAGVPVSAEGNYQMRIYALGAIAEFGDLYDFKDVRETIVQPKLDSISEETLTKDELLAWGETIKPLAQLAWEGKGEFHDGEHCRFCAVKALCKLRVNHMLELAQTGFDSPDVLSNGLLADMLPYLDGIEDWIKDVRKFALNQALQGVEYRGYKVVRGKRPGRVWSDEDAVVDQLARAGYTAEQYNVEPTLKSVAQMDKILGISTFDALLSKMTYQGQGSPTLVPESDKREPFNDVKLAFADLND